MGMFDAMRAGIGGMRPPVQRPQPAMQNMAGGLAGMQKPGIGPSLGKIGMVGQNMGMKPPMGQQASPQAPVEDLQGQMGGMMQPQVQPMNPQQGQVGQGNAFGAGIPMGLGNRPLSAGPAMGQGVGPSQGGMQGLMAKAKMMQGRR